MTDQMPLWPAKLDHICLTSGQPEVMLDFYQRGIGYESERIDDDSWLLRGAQRRLLLRAGTAGGMHFMAFRVDQAGRLKALRDFAVAQGLEVAASPSPLFGDEAFAVEDTDGNRLVFGLAAEEAGENGALPANLQHLAVASTGLEALANCYEHKLGFRLSDTVLDEDRAMTGCFYRSDPEHHTIAMFAASYRALDHHAYEVPSWNHIRDWADRFAGLRVPIWWGPGRHGPGDNLFIMVQDPDKNKVEFSAELELMPYEQGPREWPHGEHTLNLWGTAWIRD